jgi:hypothetical protein
LLEQDCECLVFNILTLKSKFLLLLVLVLSHKIMFRFLQYM